MIGVDTNVLLRAMVRDDVAQYRQAAGFFAQRSPQDPAYICLTVLVEFVWSLTRTYRYPRSDVWEAVRRLSNSADIVLEKQEIVERCVFEEEEHRDLADLLIAAGNLAEGCSHTVTFDQDAARLVAGMEHLT